MCGFGGVVLAGDGSVPGGLLARMGDTIRHRGPDSTRIAELGSAGMVHCRLAIIDLSHRADQPFRRENESPVIAFNGEIYNYRELRAGLAQRGIQFTSDADTEVLLATLVHDGVEGLGRLRGMFALALWHAETHELLLARDPLGKKPLFYAWRDDGALVFGSTIETVLTGLGRTPGVSRVALGQYLAHLVVPQEYVIFEGVHRVQPGSWIRFGRAKELARGTWWEPATRAEWRGDNVELEREIESRLRESVRRRLVSDVPVGAFLSSGLDSGTVVALMAQESAQPVITFCAGTPGDPADERPAARAVAERYGTRHVEVDVPPLSAADLPALIRQAGEPFGDASLLPSARVAAAARNTVKVALTGDGGDELFFGYSVFAGVRLAEQLRRFAPAGMSRALRSLVGDDSAPGARNKLDALLEYVGGPLDQVFRNRMGWDKDDRRRLLRGVELAPAEDLYGERLARYTNLDDADALRRTLLTTWLPDDYLTKVDLATMAVALEARCPFLDLDLVELLLKVPSRVAFPRGRRKSLLMPLASRLLPPAILNRPKSGFAVPIRQWLLGPLREPYHRFVVAPGSAIHEWIDPAAAQDAYLGLERGSARADRVWLLFVLGVWGAVVLDRSLAPDEPLLAGAA